MRPGVALFWLVVIYAMLITGIVQAFQGDFQVAIFFLLLWIGFNQNMNALGLRTSEGPRFKR